jgi:protein-tyrosine phosphatase
MTEVAMTFTVLFVCTGNICRSPSAELLFRDRLRPGADVSVTSAGTHGLAGYGVDQPTALALRELGIDPDGHRARRLDAHLLEATDLVLTAASIHLAVVLQTRPSVLTRTFTLREFGRLATERDLAHSRPDVMTPSDLRMRVTEVASRRESSAQVGAGENDIPDPFGASPAVTRATVTAISTYVDAALDGLNLRGDRTAST